ncbi:MAG: glycosyltransferase family 4 protein [Bacteroidetes bacterium]|nr:glycosyltransferase family 4 protein [Bacteroidota bacterium]
MKFLILTQYFPPEVGAPQNRLFELALRLIKLNVEVTILTAMPNYPQMEIYEEYKSKTYLYEEKEGLKIHRSSIFVSKNKSIVNRLRNYFSFVFSSILTSKKLENNYDFLMCESPPLFLGYSALYLARKKSAKLIFNVSDLWPESAEKLGVVTNSFLLKLAYNLEAKLYKKSVLVTGQTQGICKNIINRFPNVKTYWLPNGVDLNYYNPEKINNDNWREKNNFKKSDLIFLYAGIIGIAQGLEVILNAAKSFISQPNIKFILLGNGPEKEKLIDLKNKLNLKNVYFLNPVSKTEMPVILKNCNATIIPLKKLDIFKGAIPSKIFESLAMEIPILLGVDGEAKKLFIDDAKAGLFFEPENVNELVNCLSDFCNNINELQHLGKNGRNYALTNFNREKIAENLHQQLLKLN